MNYEELYGFITHIVHSKKKQSAQQVNLDYSADPFPASPAPFKSGEPVGHGTLTQLAKEKLCSIKSLTNNVCQHMSLVSYASYQPYKNLASNHQQKLSCFLLEHMITHVKSMLRSTAYTHAFKTWIQVRLVKKFLILPVRTWVI